MEDDAGTRDLTDRADHEKEPGQTEDVRGGWFGTLLAIAIGLVGAAVIWIGAPFSDNVVGNLSMVAGSSPITDTYLPPIVVFMTLLLVVLVNPLLRLVSYLLSSISPGLCGRLVLTKPQLALIVGIMLMACVLPGQGLLKSLPYMLVQAPIDASENRQFADVYKELNLRPSLFPAKLGFEEKVPVAEDFVNMLPPADRNNPKGPRVPIPWKAWLPPLFTWGLFIIPMWMMMIGLALIVLPQWRNNERLSFPLLQLQESMIETPEPGHVVAPLFRSWAFWVPVTVVIVLHVMAGYRVYYPTQVPEIPLRWDLNALFTEGPLRYVPWYVKSGQFFFLFIGLAFFMPGRIGFSIWFTQVGYAIYTTWGQAYMQPFHPAVVIDHRMGAMWAVAGAILWFGRAHWWRVLKAMFRFPQTDEDVRNMLAAMLFVVGIIGMFLWLVWMKVQIAWAVFLVVFGFTLTLVVTRIIAETGMAFFRIHLGYYISFVHLAPAAWLTLPTVFFARFFAILVEVASRVNVTAMATHAIGLDRFASPRRQWRTALILFWVLVIGLVVCGGAHVWFNYHYDASIGGQQQQRPLNGWGLSLVQWGAENDAVMFKDHRWPVTKAYDQVGHIVFGFVAAVVLQVACVLSPKWPLHPIGLLMADAYYAQVTFISIFIGWMAKILIVRYGGARLYKTVRPLFLGLIVGEVFAAMFWIFEPAVRLLFGITYKIITIQP